MEYINLIKNTAHKINQRFEELNSDWENEPIFKECFYNISGTVLFNEHQLLDSVLYYYPKLTSYDEDGVDICISFVQSVINTNAWTEFSSSLHYTENGDLYPGKDIYIISDICTSKGSMLFENEIYHITIKETGQLDKDISTCLDKIFLTFKSKKELAVAALDKSNSH
jgi:hypothetical protein